MSGEKKAKSTWKRFHKRGEIDWTKKVTLKAPFPAEWGCVGRCVTTYYASDKWQEDRTFFERYYHDHDEGTKIWLPVGTLVDLVVEDQPPKSVTKKPGEVADLGLALGFDVLRSRTGKKGKFVPSPDAHLVCSPDGRRLYVLEDSRIVALIWGPTLRVEPRGIVG